ncbi:MAG: hypothetical protein RSD81_10505 [Pseudomonas sp.]
MQTMTRSERIPMCPVCGAPLRLAESTTISWDDSKKEFLVKIQGECSPCGFHEELALKSLPVLIATTSSCSCGATLTLKNHAFTLSGKELDFTASYQCTSCTKNETTTMQKFFAAVRSVWKDTTSIEVGPGGVKYSKESSSKSAP